MASRREANWERVSASAGVEVEVVSKVCSALRVAVELVEVAVKVAVVVAVVESCWRI